MTSLPYDEYVAAIEAEHQRQSRLPSTRRDSGFNRSPLPRDLYEHLLKVEAARIARTGA
jgi:hypothetical protein